MTEPDFERTCWRVDGAIVDPSGLTISGPGGETCVEPMVMDVLLVLLAHAGDVVSRKDLVDAVWQAEYGGDERLTRAISLLRKAFGDSHGIRRVIETVPKRGYRLIAAATPLDKATATEPLTNRTIESKAERGETLHPKRKGWTSTPRLAFAAAAAALIMGMLAIPLLNQPSPEAEDVAQTLLARTVAAGRIEVGAFQTGSTDPGLQALAGSMPANMTAILSDAGLETAIAGAAAQTRAEFTVRGQLEETGTVHRAIVELFDAAEGVVVWSETFERDPDETAFLSSQIGASVAWTVRCALGIRGDALEADSVAFRQYARFCRATREKAQMKNLPAFTEAILQREPGRPTAQALHAWALAEQAMWDEYIDDETRQDQFGQAEALADQALSRAPDSPYAHLAHAAISASKDEPLKHIGHLEAASRSSHAPPLAITNLAYQYRRMGRIAEAQRLLARSLAIDPYDVYVRTQFALMHSILGNRTRAHQEFDRVARDNPDWWELYWRKLQVELFNGDAAAGLDYLDRVVARRSPIEDHLVVCARAFGEARLVEQPDLAAFAAACGSDVQADWRARMYAVLGDLDASFAAMDEFPTDMASVTVVFFYPEMEAFRKDPRFWPMAAKFGLVDYWLESDAWPDFCGDERLDYDCRRRARITKQSTTIQ
ncbi:MAG: winged helix-turn-helix domain-containing protein [Pseudomonadota bacterium]